MWIYLDNDNRVQGYNPNNMAGNTGWVEAAEAPPENHTDYLYVDGEYIYDPPPASEEPAPTPTDAERITALETTMSALIGGIMDAVQ